MSNGRQKIYLFTCLLLIGSIIFAYQSNAQKAKDSWAAVIPPTWVDAEMLELEIPLANPIGSPKHINADYYYRIPERQIYKSYPMYSPGKEPSGYLDWLKQQEPEIAFDVTKLKTESDWIKAGELVFDAPVSLFPVDANATVRTPEWYAKLGMPLTKEGINPFMRYVVAQKGRVLVGFRSCAECHTRVLADGSIIKGAQGNFPFDRADAFDVRAIAGRIKVEDIRSLEMANFYAPWIKPGLSEQLERMSAEEIAQAHEAIPPGVVARHRTSSFYPVQIPDLIGVKERKYLDRTGLQHHRSIVDLMRYGALNQGADDLASYAGFIPGARDSRTLPEPKTQRRYSDAQLYALALYLYSLQPPANPNKFDALAKRGQRVFEQQGCAKCHTPPLYTNNRLTPVDGFAVPEEHKKKYDILPVSVGTDPSLALKTRRGTGYYKVPSLKGVWYRGPFEHSGSVATLEDWFDPKRLRDDYMPTGFVGYGLKTRGVKGHEFGLQLSAEDKRALIAFLKTL